MIIKIILIVLFMSSLNLIRHMFKIFQILKNEELPNKYEISKPELIMVGLSISYILTIILTGFKI